MGHIDGYYEFEPPHTKFCSECGRECRTLMNGVILCDRCAVLDSEDWSPTDPYDDDVALEPCEYCDALGAKDHSDGCPNSEYPTDPDDDPHEVRP